LLDPVHPADPAAFADASDLIARFGQYAGQEAAARAEKSRDAGNIIHFARWRQAERAVAMVAGGMPAGTLH